MTMSSYSLNTTGWSDCGSADDCLLQIPGGICVVIFTTATSDPGTAVKDEVRLSTDPGDHRSAAVQRPGLKL